mgnify:CR=1 FL=1
MKKVSLIIPVYNSEDFLDRCIVSLKKQTYKDLEIIFINDGSSDLSEQKITSYMMNDNRIFLLNKDNGGVSSARNLGLNMCTGDYVMFVDADDFLEDTTVEFCVDLFSKHNIDMVRFNYYKNYSNHLVKNINYFENDRLLAYPFDEVVKKIYYNDNYCSSCLTMYKSSVVKGTVFDVNLSIGEDFLFFIRCLFKCNNIYVSNNCLYHYVYNSHSATCSLDYNKYVESIKGLLNVVDSIDKMILENTTVKSKSNLKLERNIYDYFKESYIKEGNTGIEKLKTLILNDDYLCEKLKDKKLDIFKISTISKIGKIKILLKKTIKKILTSV